MLFSQSHLTLCDSMDCSLPGSSVHGLLQVKNTGKGRHSLLQGSIFLTQGSKPGLLHWGRFFAVWATRKVGIYTYQEVYIPPDWKKKRHTFMIARGREESDTTEWLHFHFLLPCIGEGNGNPLQCSFLENPRDSRARWAAVYGVTQSRTWLKWLSNSSNSRKISKENKPRTCKWKCTMYKNSERISKGNCKTHF